MDLPHTDSLIQSAKHVRDQMPEGGMFGGHTWRIAPEPLNLDKKQVKQLDKLGKVLLSFYKASNQIYRKSVDGKLPGWIADWLDRGKPEELIKLQRTRPFRFDIPRVIRPDLLITEDGFALTELDSVPGGVGLTAWFNQTYASAGHEVLGGANGMLDGFKGIFGDARNVHLTVSEESGTYRPEMEWLSKQPGFENFAVRDEHFTDAKEGDAVYRFFELFDLPNIPSAEALFQSASAGDIQLTPPPRPVLEEKMWMALLWSPHLQEFWKQELGSSHLETMQRITPLSWIIDPAPIPHHASIPHLNLTSWSQLKTLSQKQRDLILKISGFSETAWGARGVHLGSDMSSDDWGMAVDAAIRSADKSPYLLQRFHKPTTVPVQWYDFEEDALQTMTSRIRLCPYYFVHGDFESASIQLGGVMATACPADKKIIHGMTDAIITCCKKADSAPRPA
ncbi:hypothetical protein N9B94_02915 [Verrucomicrobia bacterium]|nr:hypothetical protein [Verrucomicrobiota bacterium]